MSYLLCEEVETRKKQIVKKSELIIKLADNELAADEKDKLEKEIYRSPELMQEYLTQIQLNNFLQKKFRSEQIADNFLASDKEIESLEKKSLDTEAEAFDTGTFKATMNLINDFQDESSGDEYSARLKEFAATGINARKEKVKKRNNFKVIKKDETFRKESILSKWYFIAASAAAVLVISFLIYKNISAPLSSDDLYVEYYKSYHFVTEQTRSSDKITDNMVHDATKLYKSEKYAEASVLVMDALELNNKHVKARFIYGLTLLEASNYTTAAKQFSRILSNHDSYNIESRWYLALCYLKQEKSANAKRLLSELSQSKNLYQKRAIKILDELD